MRFAQGLSRAFGPLDAYWAARYELSVRGRWWRFHFTGPAWSTKSAESVWPLPVGGLGVTSAFNPHSRSTPEHENIQRNSALREDLVALGLEFGPTLASARDGTMAEPGFAIVQIGQDALLALARKYEQVATVHVSNGHSGLLLTQTGQTLRRGHMLLSSAGPMSDDPPRM